MKKSDFDIQNENAILLAIAIADGYYPVNKKQNDKEINRKITETGFKSYKEAYNHVYAGMPQYVGDNAIFSGKMTLVNKNKDYIDFSLGNLEQTKDEFLNIPIKLVQEFVSKHASNVKNLDATQIIKNKYTMYNFLKTYVIPSLLKDRQSILAGNQDNDNMMQSIKENNVINNLFDYKFSADKHVYKARGNRDKNFYSLTHGMIDAVLDLYASIDTAFDEFDIDVRAINPNPCHELGLK